MKRYIATFVIIALTRILPDATASVRLKDMTFMPVVNLSAVRFHGYTENIVRITNGSGQKRVLRLQAPAIPYSAYWNGITRLERTITIAPYMTVETSLPIPALMVSGSRSMSVYVNGENWGRINLPELAANIDVHSANTSILTSRSINAARLQDALRAKTNTLISGQQHTVTRAELELSSWSRNWLAYTRFDAIVLHKNDITALSSELRSTLHRYVSAGGSLVIAGSLENPFNWSCTPVTINDIVTTSKKTRKKVSTNFTPTPDDRKNIKKLAVGFGELVLMKNGEPHKAGRYALQIIANVASYGRKPWRNSADLTTANIKLPVTSGMQIPKRGMFVIMLIFSIVIGPVTMFILARKNRRIWLLWIAPALSVVVCTITALYSIFSEGFTPTVNSRSVTLLDQQTHQATTIGMLGIYCPLTPSGGLNFSADAEISVYGIRRYSHGTGRTIDWTKTQNLKSGWVSARVPAFFKIRIPQTRRERIEIIGTGKKAKVFNGLGSKIEKLWIRTADNTWLTIAHPLKNGGKAKLIPDTSQPHCGSARIREIFSASDWVESFSRLPQKRACIIRPGMYLAELEGAPFLSHGLHGKVDSRQKSFVIGYLPTAATTQTEPQ